jgi:hypothetical protein
VDLENGMVLCVDHVESPLEQRLDVTAEHTDVVKFAPPFHNKVMTSATASELAIEIEEWLYMIKGFTITNVSTGEHSSHRGVQLQARLNALSQQWDLETVNFGARQRPWKW